MRCDGDEGIRKGTGEEEGRGGEEPLILSTSRGVKMWRAPERTLIAPLRERISMRRGMMSRAHVWLGHQAMRQRAGDGERRGRKAEQGREGKREEESDLSWGGTLRISNTTITEVS
jgi:hypothetical protein